MLPPPRSTLFPYTTLFRSELEARRRPLESPVADGQVARRRPRPARDPHDHHRSADEPPRPRSEEHTSELQSRGHLVCRLLLEKKKKNKKKTIRYRQIKLVS